MTSIALHPAPRWRAVAEEQLRAVGVSLRKETIAFLTVLGVLGALVLIVAMKAAVDPRQHVAIEYGPGVTVPLAIAALMFPFGVWRSEDPSRRSYHWAMPVARSAHTLTKVLAGWVWLMAHVAAYVLFIAALVWLTALVEGEQPGWSAAWHWVVPFTSASVAYLLTSVVVLATDHPWRWIGGLTVGYLFVFLLCDIVEWEAGEQTLERVMDGSVGLQTAIFGDVGERAGRWLGATLLWGAIGALGTGAAAYWQRDAG